MDALWKIVPRILFVTNNVVEASSQWRVWWPAMELVSHGYIADYVTFNDLQKVLPHVASGRWNVIVTTRMSFGQEESEKAWMEVVKFCNANNIKWIYDADDDLFSENFINRLTEANKEKITSENLDDANKQRLGRIKLLGMADSVTTASKALVDVVGRYTDKKVQVIPNGIDIAWFVERLGAQARTVEPLTIGWAGGARLERDIDPIYDVWPVIAREFPDVKFVMYGWAPDRLRKLIPNGQLYTIDVKPLNEYALHLKNIDIFCCFATDEDWVKTKTPIKYMEATVAGSVCIVSQSLYGDIVQDNYDGCIAYSTEDWLKYLRMLIKNNELRHNLYKHAAQKVLDNHSIKTTYKNWLDVLSSQLTD